MKDCKEELLHGMEESLVVEYTKDQIRYISNVLTILLDKYDVTRRCTDIVPYDFINERIMKQYCACLYVDGKSERTVYQYKRTCFKLANAVGKTFPEIGVYDIRYFLACEKERGISDRSLENTRSNISAFFQWMAREDIIGKNPCLNIKPIKYNDVVRKPFSDIEIDALKGACNTEKQRALVEILLSTGMRVSELANLCAEDIDGSNLSVHIRHGKGGKERITYTTNVAYTHLTAYWNERPEKGSAAFYGRTNMPISVAGIQFILKEIAKRAMVSNVHPHRFRRTFASGLATRGMDIQEIKLLLGHTDINTTMEYIYTSDLKTHNSYQRYIA